METPQLGGCDIVDLATQQTTALLPTSKTPTLLRESFSQLFFTHMESHLEGRGGDGQL